MERRAFLRRLVLLSSSAVFPAPTIAHPSFPPVLPRRLVFPRDHGAHPEFRSEWWYVTGWLDEFEKRPLGFQLTFFRVRTGHGEDNASRFSPRQLLFAHAAIADPAWGRLRIAEKSARADGRLAGYSLETSGIWIGKWSLFLADGIYRIAARSADFAFALTLAPSSPPLLHGQEGFSQKAPDRRHASFYYSRPQLRIEGELELAGRRREVSGAAWLDHEWSSELLPEEAQGWDWLGVNFDDGGALMAFRMRDAQEEALWAAATWSSPDGRRRTYSPDEVLLSPGRRWRSPRTDISWPVGWRLQVGGQRWSIEPLFDDQELDARRSVGAIYWEGAVRVFAGDRRPIGRGYLEMTGYGEKIRVGR